MTVYFFPKVIAWFGKSVFSIQIYVRILSNLCKNLSISTLITTSNSLDFSLHSSKELMAKVKTSASPYQPPFLPPLQLSSQVILTFCAPADPLFITSTWLISTTFPHQLLLSFYSLILTVAGKFTILRNIMLNEFQIINQRKYFTQSNESKLKHELSQEY